MLKNIVYYSLCVVFSLSIYSCEGLFELYPKDQLLEKDFWITENDVEAAVINCYYQLRRCQDEMITSGLVRSDIVKVNDNQLQNAQKGVFVSNYKICEWSRWYSLIQAANLVITKAPGVMDKDPGYTEIRNNQLIGEAKFMRAFAYFYLIRMWKEVPIVTEPSLNDAQDYFPALSSADKVFTLIEEDLSFAATHMLTSYEGKDEEETEMKTRGRATKGAVYALSSDVYLWQNKYQECIDACDKVINSTWYDMMPPENWWDIYNPQKGNCHESIFELNYDDDYDYATSKRNSRWNWTIKEWFNDRLRAVPQISINWRYPDVRYYTLTGTGGNLVRKHIGNDMAGTGIIPNTLTPNWIIYRLPHVLFNKMEAMNRLDSQGSISEINKMIKQIELRAGVFEYEPISGGEGAIEEAILNYKLRETAYEGTRWFDLVRIGKRQWEANKTGEENILVKQLTAIFSESIKPFVRGNLNNPEAWYLPIHESEILKNPNIEQNPFYNNL
ncbi:MAG: RagB/SusD family nutrient uptake outer membrane protein [Carboxylicivirga sp.]|jgi:hypothetical protein|nr:RagB/SusD family nutrient uptake outer membrane protein [Carboxylicivirga sp.]